MNYSFEYIDIILLAMIAGFIFLRLRGILGKRTGFDGNKVPPQFQEVLKNVNTEITSQKKDSFDQNAQTEFLKGAKIAYETIITDFSDEDNKITNSKPLLRSKLYKYYMSLIGFTSTEISNEDMGEYSTLCNSGGTMVKYTSCDFQNVVVNNCSTTAFFTPPRTRDLTILFVSS